MLTQLAAKPFNDQNADRECHSLSAGFALGVLNLGCGSKLPSVRHIGLDEKLFRFIEGGSEPVQPVKKPSNTKAASKNEFQSSNVP